MNILFYTTNEVAPQYGGVERVTANIANALTLSLIHICDYIVETLKLFSISKKQLMRRMTFEGLDEIVESMNGQTYTLQIKETTAELDETEQRIISILSLIHISVEYIQSGKYIILKKKQKNIVISGFIRDKSSSESLIGCLLYTSSHFTLNLFTAGVLNSALMGSV